MSKDSQCFFLVSFTSGALQNDPVDEGGWFPQMFASRKTTAEYIKLTKISVLSVFSVAKTKSVKSVKSVSNFPSCLGAFVAETQLVRRSLGEGGSIKTY